MIAIRIISPVFLLFAPCGQIQDYRNWLWGYRDALIVMLTGYGEKILSQFKERRSLARACIAQDKKPVTVGKDLTQAGLILIR